MTKDPAGTNRIGRCSERYENPPRPRSFSSQRPGAASFSAAPYRSTVRRRDTERIRRTLRVALGPGHTKHAAALASPTRPPQVQGDDATEPAALGGAESGGEQAGDPERFCPWRPMWASADPRRGRIRSGSRSATRRRTRRPPRGRTAAGPAVRRGDRWGDRLQLVAADNGHAGLVGDERQTGKVRQRTRRPDPAGQRPRCQARLGSCWGRSAHSGRSDSDVDQGESGREFDCFLENVLVAVVVGVGGAGRDAAGFLEEVRPGGLGAGQLLPAMRHWTRGGAGPAARPHCFLITGSIT